MPSNVSEIAQDIYRISTFHPEYGIQFNQFLPASSTSIDENGAWPISSTSGMVVRFSGGGATRGMAEGVLGQARGEYVPRLIPLSSHGWDVTNRTALRGVCPRRAVRSVGVSPFAS